MYEWRSQVSEVPESHSQNTPVLHFSLIPAAESSNINKTRYKTEICGESKEGKYLKYTQIFDYK